MLTGLLLLSVIITCFNIKMSVNTIEKEMATHSSVLARRIPVTEEPGGLPSMGSHGVRHDWNDLAAAANTICVNIYVCISVEENNGYFIFLYILYFPKFSWHKIYFSTDCFFSKYPLIVINMDKFHINLIMFIKVLDSFLLVLCHIQVGTSSQLSVAMNLVSKMRIFTKLQILS